MLFYESDRAAHGRHVHAHCLIDTTALEQFSDTIGRMADKRDEALLSQLVNAAQATSPVITMALKEARAVLQGRTDAAERLGLLLHGVATTDTGPALPDELLRKSYGDTRADAPYIIEREGLQDLIGGVVWAARNEQEETDMLASLRKLLDPLLKLEHAWNATRSLGKGRQDIFKTFLFYHRELPVLTNLIPISDSIIRPVSDTFNPGDVVGNGGIIHDRVKDWTDIWGCMGRGRRAVSVIDRFAPRYQINFISNPIACGGKQILITGTNFGPQGKVYFPAPEPGDPLFEVHRNEIRLDGVDPIAWDDSAITVVVPVWAVSGMIHLKAFRRVSDPCWIKDIVHLGNEFEFSGGLASVYEVFVNRSPDGTGINGEFVIPPNDVFLLGYRATARQDVEISVQIIADGTTLFDRDELVGGFNTFPVQLTTAPAEPTRGEMIISAKSSCGATQPLRVPVVIAIKPVLTIEYIEVTQGVQVSKDEVEAGKAVPLVSNKDSAVRVYLRCDRGGWFQNRLDKISGAVRMSTPGGNFQVPPTNTRPAKRDRGMIEVIGHSHDTDEFTTLNFFLPAGWCSPGPHTLTITVRCADITGLITLSQTISWTWIEKPVIRTRWLFLNPGNFDEFNLYPLADQFLRDVLRYLPTPVWDVGPAWKNSFTHDRNLKDREDWSDLLDDLEGFKNCTFWDDINPFADHCESIDDGARWVAIIRPGVDTEGSGLRGIASTPGMVTAVVMTDYIAAHELGHTLGREHVNLTEKGNTVPGDLETVENGGYASRPAFDVQQQKVILREAGKEDNFGRINPMPADLMSYYEPLFLTATNWRRIVDSL